MAILKPSFNSSSILSIIHTEIDLHPHLTLIDIYKLMFQAYYGPTHMIPDNDIIIKGIINERSSMKHGYQPLLQDIGAGTAFHRISLSILPNLKPVTEAEILAKYILLSRQAFDTTWPEWKSAWTETLKVMHDNNIHFVDINDDIDSLFEQRALPSHSPIFHDNYSPHYRLVHYTQLPALLEALK